MMNIPTYNTAGMKQAAEAIAITVNKFARSNKGINDYIELIIVASRNANSMSWEQIEQTLKENTSIGGK